MDHLKLHLGDEFRPVYEHPNVFDPNASTPTTVKDVYLDEYLQENEEDPDKIIKYSFHDFPEVIAGWRLNGDFQFEQISGMKVIPFKRFLQSWLFFGLMHTVIQLKEGEMVMWEHFTDGIPSNLTINTLQLEKYLMDWHDWELEQKDILEQSIRMIRIQVALDTARAVVLRYCSEENAATDENDAYWIPLELGLSLMVLGETLTAAKAKIVQKVGFNIRGWHGDANEGWGTPPALIQRMRTEQWCERTIHMLRGQFRSHATHLLSAYKSQNFGPKDGEMHVNLKCDSRQCKVKSMDTEGKYETRHQPGCKKDSSCTKIGPDADKLLQALEGPHYPLLEYDKQKSTMEVVSYKPHKQYATISHVWADGYGNPSGNWLRKCQLDFFHNLFENLPDHYRGERDSKYLSFWIDTLAIPCAANDAEPKAVKKVAKARRKKAIGKIHEIYTKAKYTIVIDNGLAESRLGSEYHTAAMKILASGWMRRLWTLQEAYLSNRLFFAFKNHALANLDDLEEKYPQANDILTSNIPDAARNYFHNLLGPDRKARIHNLPPANGVGLLASVWRAAQWRVSTH
jgi:hypothetical protein